ncbi:monovalent cation/H(+) antiporter subunit G [Fulvimarina endophytica]|uniref:Monovalent cation/H(+) antiporter subunit G n=1 Tax=Fulvimarina endophytica TaxID=2293836 RepID=A0A371X0B2_9HYPH|nr:monovalent cation/H(+) antiporter subunit G [Fulvimarina endophytica]
MSEAIFDTIDGILMIGGSIFVVLAAVGLLRLPDLYTRMHAASKAGPVGAGLLLLALALNAGSSAEALRAVAAILFLLLTAPIAAHLLAKASYKVGYGLWPGSVLDEMPRVRNPEGEDPYYDEEGSQTGLALHEGQAGEPAWRRETKDRRPRWSDLRKR